MRLLACAIFSLLLHSIFFRNTNIKINTPSLVISNQEKTIDLKIRTQVVRKKTAPELQKQILNEKKPIKKEAVKKVAEKIVKKIVKKEAKKKEIKIPKKIKKFPIKTKGITKEEKTREEEIKDQSSLAANKQAYVSKATPRLVHRAEYLSNPPPEYPKQARRRRQEGTVTLLVELDSKGVVSKIQIKKSSGFSSLDRAAKKAVAKWQFTPASVNKKTTSSKVIVPVLFKLNT